MPDPAEDPFDMQLRRQRVDALACRYPYEPLDSMLPAVANELRGLAAARTGRHSEATKRELIVATGWCQLLGACLYQDAGNVTRATNLAALADISGREGDEPTLRAWAREILAYQQVTAQRWSSVVQTARDAADAWGGTDVVIQLRLQQALGHAALGERAAVLWCTNEAAKLVERQPHTSTPEHHFIFDGRKFSFYLARIYGMLGDLPAMREHVGEVMAGAIDAGGTTRWPMRVAAMQLESALGAVAAGDLDSAVALGRRALLHSRRSASLLPRAVDLGRALETRWPNERRQVGSYSLLLFTAQRHRMGAP